MMSVRWKVFELKCQIPESRQQEVPPCAACFARLMLNVCVLKITYMVMGFNEERFLTIWFLNC